MRSMFCGEGSEVTASNSTSMAENMPIISSSSLNWKGLRAVWRDRILKEAVLL